MGTGKPIEQRVSRALGVEMLLRKSLENQRALVEKEAFVVAVYEVALLPLNVFPESFFALFSHCLLTGRVGFNGQVAYRILGPFSRCGLSDSLVCCPHSAAAQKGVLLPFGAGAFWD